MKTATLILLKEQLKELSLSHFSQQLETVLRQAENDSLAYEDFLLNLTEHEVSMRKDHRQKRRLKEARFPLVKTLEGFDFQATPQLDTRLLMQLAEGDYIGTGDNILFLGNSGVGKSHLATALGVEACKQNVRTRFVTGYALANELIEARDERKLARLMDKYARYGLLIVDELGYVPFSKDAAELLFQVLAQRHEKHSIIITSNLGLGDWTKIFGCPTMTAALLDRLTCKAKIFNCQWESYRLKQSRDKKQNSSKVQRTLAGAESVH